LTIADGDTIKQRRGCSTAWCWYEVLVSTNSHPRNPRNPEWIHGGDGDWCRL